MNENNKELQLIAKLVKETVNRKIEWYKTRPPRELTCATEDEIYSYFEAEYKDKFVAIFERRYKHFYDECEFNWGSKYSFAILDDEKDVLAEYSQWSPALDDLFKTVRQQVVDIDSLLNDLLE